MWNKEKQKLKICTVRFSLVTSGNTYAFIFPKQYFRYKKDRLIARQHKMTSTQNYFAYHCHAY